MMRPYGPPIYDAIERGDARKLETLLNNARTLHEQQGGDLSKAIRAGEAALKKLQKGGGGASASASAKAPAKKAAPAKASGKASAAKATPRFKK
jgi:hypothetical protein